MSQLTNSDQTVELPDGEANVDPQSSPGTSGSPISRDGNTVAHILRSVFGWVPSVLVVAALVAVGWYGHKNDWKAPMTSSTSTLDDSEWCYSHGVPEDECIVCQAGLIEDAPELSFCNEHGVYGCVFCDPSLAESKQPTMPTASDLERATRALAMRPRTENLSIGGSAGSPIQFASIAAMNKAGVDVEPVERREIAESIVAAGEILYNATNTAYVSPQSDGIVRRVFAEIGDWVKPGQVLALIDSTDAGRLKTELLAALADERLQLANVARLRPLAGEAIAGKRLLESENERLQASAVVDRAAGALGNLGIEVDLIRLRQWDATESDAYVRRLGLGDATSELPLNESSRNLIAVIAPLGGQIVQRAATLGQVVDRGRELFRVVDTSNVWLDLRVAAEDAPLVKLGQTVQFWPDGQRQKHQGNVTWISSEVDPQTRTVRVRAELANVDNNLRNESFGRGEIVLRDEPDAIAVPESALQWDGSGQVVFVRDAKFFEEGRPKFFISRSVRTGVKQDGFVEILAGVLPGEVVATSGSEVLRAQLLRSNLGAGCTCAE